MTRILKNKKFRFFTILFLCLTVCFGFGNIALAQEDVGWMQAIVNMVSNPFDTIFGGIAAGIAFVFIKFFGILISLVLWAVIHIAEYNTFTGEESIIMGWKVVRDFCNMFFILVLLLIAFATILRQENYSMKRLLPKLIIMAVLINFSLTICGIIIDFSQVVMLTFIDAIGNSGGNYINHLGVQNYLNLTKDNIINNNDDFNLVSNLAGLALGVVFLAIATVVLVVLLGVLVARIVMLWVYIVLSPLAFLLSAFPGGQSYASRWWDEFIKNVIVGPVLAFFIWLSLISVDTIDKIGKLDSSAKDMCFGPADILCPQEFLAFVVAIGMLMGGLTIAQSLGGAGGAAAGKGLNAIHKGRALSAKVVMLPARGGKALGNLGINKLHEKTGIDLNVKRVYRGIQSKREEINAERYANGQIAAGKAMATGGKWHGMAAMTGSPGTGWEQMWSKKGRAERWKGGAKMAQNKEKYEKELDQAKYKEKFTGLSKKEQLKKVSEMSSESLALHNMIKTESNAEKKKQLQEQKNNLDQKLSFASTEATTARPHQETEKMISDFRDRRKELEGKVSENTASYDFDAKSKELSAVNKKAAQIADITDGGELLRILKDAIQEKDKNMIKAIVKKMAKNGDENDIFKELAGNSGVKGMHDFMNGLADKNNKDLYSGFNQQEAYSLGSEVSNIAKGTLHWSVAGGYKMQNGDWKEATEEEQAEFHGKESSKVHVQKLVRETGRLGYGEHDENNVFHINVGGVKMLQNLDTKGGVEEIKKNMQISAAQNLAGLQGKESLDALHLKGLISEELREAIKERAASKQVAGRAAKTSHEDIKAVIG